MSKPAPDFLDKLEMFPKIKQNVELYWGTLHLKQYLDGLLNDTREGTRRGFPAEVSTALLYLSLDNTALLEERGMSFDMEPVSRFAPPPWELPKNF